MTFTAQSSRQPDPLERAFCEYAIKTWDEHDWTQFGRETGTRDILTNDPRLYRSLSFGDDDYDDAVYRVAPLVLHEALGADDSPKERMQLLVDYAPDMLSWVQTNASRRTKRNFMEYLNEHRSSLPQEWLDALNPPSFAEKEGPSHNFEQTAGMASNTDAAPTLSTGTFEASPASARVFHESTREAPPMAPFATEYAARAAWATSLNKGTKQTMQSPGNIFIVHGHDHSAVNIVKLFVHEVTGIMPHTLADRPGRGNTIIEKFEKETTNVAYAIVLLTPDDEGRVRIEGENSGKNLQARARQNVVLELGYFFGKLGRDKVAVLNAGVEQPSDVHGLQYIPYPGPDWKEELRRELTAAKLV